MLCPTSSLTRSAQGATYMFLGNFWFALRRQCITLTSLAYISTTSSPRRYEIDAVRIIVLGLLILYHATIMFQPWAHYLLIPQNDSAIEWLWNPMQLLNVWRIPILFVISGMALWYSLIRYNVKQVLKHRLRRLGWPLAFGWLALGPFCLYQGMVYYTKPAIYVPTPHYLWFLNNIIVYILVLLPLGSYIARHETNWIHRWFVGGLTSAYGLPISIVLCAGEAWVVNPDDYPRFFDTVHGFILGLLCFLLGLLYAAAGEAFWQRVRRLRYGTLSLALVLYSFRLIHYGFENVPNPLIGIEAIMWIWTVLGFSTMYLNRPSQMSSYITTAVFPIYILHYPIQFSLSWVILPLNLPPEVKLLLLISGVLGISLAIYEIALRRMRLLGPIFGLSAQHY